jgi:FkbM family methyltransferase
MKKFIRNLLSHYFIADPILKIAHYIVSNNSMPQNLKNLIIKLRHYLPKKKIITKIEFKKGIKATYLLNLKSFGDREIFYCNYEPAVLDFYQRILPSKEVVWDIGSCTGFYVVLAGLVLKGKGEVFAFEPVPINYDALAKNVRLNNLTNVHLFNLALSSEDGEAEIYLLDLEKPTSSPTLNRNWAEKSGLYKLLKVKTRSAMSLLDKGEILRPDIIKIDAETYEPIILRDLKPLLMQNDAPDILSEIMPPSIEPLRKLLIEECNYKCHHINLSGLEKVEELKMRRPYNDYFFTKKYQNIWKNS